jgi:DNA-binding beta-propeller fold protein YncE
MKSITTILLILIFALFLTSRDSDGQSTSALSRSSQNKTCLPTGVCLNAAGSSFAVGNMPLGMILSPEGDRIVITLSGWREQGLQIVDRATGKITQTVSQPSSFIGLVFSPDGKTLYASGGNEDVIYVYDWKNKSATLKDRIVLAAREAGKDGTRFPAGIAISNDGKKLFVAENLADSLAMIDLESKKIDVRLPTGTYPYAVIASPEGKVYVSSWGSNIVSVFHTMSGGMQERGKIEVGRHPSSMVLNKSASRLFVVSASTNSIAAVDTKTQKKLTSLADPPPSKNQGSTPNALALSNDETKLFVAEADNNAVAVLNLSRETSDAKMAAGHDGLAGRIPTDWYPTALLLSQNSLYVLNGKGKGSKANPLFPTPAVRMADDSIDYTLGQLNGTLTVTNADSDASDLARYSKQVSDANNWGGLSPQTKKYPPFKHVIYIIKENRTYDQVFGDVKSGDGDASLVFFDSKVSPNHRALAARFGLYDRFFVNAEVSSQGHVWSTAAYVTDYGEKTIPSQYAYKRNGTDRDDVDEPASGYLWNAALKKGLTLRNYGEFGESIPNKDKNAPQKYRAVKPALDAVTNHDYPVFDMKIPDQARADVWLKDFREFVKNGNLPALEIMHLPRDHTAGGRAGLNTPKSCFADNDLALGRIVEAVSGSLYWKDTIILVLEDDAQDGPDHVDSHRSVLLTISAYNNPGAIHRFVNTTDVFATMEGILGLAPLSQFDYFGRQLNEVFSAEPDLRQYAAIVPEQSLDEINPSNTKNAKASLDLDLDEVDKADMGLFNQILWSSIKGENVPYPGTKRMSSLEESRGR